MKLKSTNLCVVSAAAGLITIAIFSSVALADSPFIPGVESMHECDAVFTLEGIQYEGIFTVHQLIPPCVRVNDSTITCAIEATGQSPILGGIEYTTVVNYPKNSPLEGSRYELISLSPSGEPFFPARGHIYYFLRVEIPDLGWTLYNDSAMELVSVEDLSTFPEIGPTFALAKPVAFSDDMGDMVVLDDATATLISYEFQAIPTLSEWGLIIFCVLLFGWMAWMIVRRRRRVAPSI